MRTLRAVTSAFLGLAPVAPGQGFGFTHEMIPVDRTDTRAVAFGDVDGDGDLDAFLGNGGLPPEGQNRLYRNGGTGEVRDVTSTNLPILLDRTWAIALGDVDGDGDLDAFLGNFSNTQNRLYLNSGTGVFASASFPFVTSFTAAIALGDVDGDGDLDAYMGIGGQDRLYLNGGTGIFTDATATNLPTLSDSTRAVALGDVDGDGDLDAFVGNNSLPGQQSRLHLNGGTGVFTDATATNLPALLAQTSAADLGVVDGDGDLDAF